VQRLDQRQEPVDVAVVEQQRLIDVGPVAAVVLVRVLGVDHGQAELPGLAYLLELAADDQNARPSSGHHGSSHNLLAAVFAALVRVSP
jgi:hypothetical protein